MEKELNNQGEWRDVVGYEGIYEVSKQGLIRRSFVKGVRVNRIIKPHITYGGYLRLCLCINGKRKQHSVHRIVAMAFIPNPSNLPFVNHKDENKSNNYVDNLEWCSESYNSNFSFAKPVEQYRDGILVGIYLSQTEASKVTGVNQHCIGRCCAGILGSAGGYQWMFSNISRSELLKKKCINFGLDTQCSQKRKRNNSVVQLSLDGKFIAQYNSSKEASDKTLVSRANISNCLNNKKEYAGGFRWMRLCDWKKDIHMKNGESILTENE